MGKHDLSEDDLEEIYEEMDVATSQLEKIASMLSSAEHKVTGKSIVFGIAKGDLREMAEEVQEVKESIENQEDGMTLEEEK